MSLRLGLTNDHTLGNMYLRSSSVSNFNWMFRKMIGRAVQCSANVRQMCPCKMCLWLHALAGLSTVPQLTSTQSGCSNWQCNISAKLPTQGEKALTCNLSWSLLFVQMNAMLRHMPLRNTKQGWTVVRSRRWKAEMLTTAAGHSCHAYI